ncbi:MAG: MrcB family domain-containing protein [Massilia sp.]
MFNIFWTLVRAMQNLIADVLDYYADTRAKLGGRAKVVDTPDQLAILQGIPDRIEKHLAHRGLADLYKVKGSIGKGNIARVPWVSIFRTAITKNAENGFYIVLLFSEDMSSCYLSLNQGVTAVERMYTKEFAWKKMRQAASIAVQNLDRDPEAIIGPIALHSTVDLSRGYEAAAIESFCYEKKALPTDATFFRQLDHLIATYDILIARFGNDLYSLFSVSEDEFQQIALERAARDPTDPNVGELVGGEPVSTAATLGSRGAVRSPKVAAGALRAANFMCEIDPQHWTFASHAKQQRYVEAHHLIPISQQSGFLFSLDVGANVVSLCATCHRLLHYGVPKEKHAILKSLLKSRKERLLLKSIEVTSSDFLSFYGKGMVLEE